MQIKQLFLPATLILGLAVPASAEHHGNKHIKMAVGSPERLESDTTRDERRKPAEILKFAGIKPGMHVADVLGGTGYYTDIMSRIVGDEGSVTNFVNLFVQNRFPKAFGPGGVIEKRQATAQWTKNVSMVFDKMENFKTAEPLDAAIMVLFYHDTLWQEVDRPAMTKAFIDALKPGGTFTIVDHAAEVGSGGRDVSTLHRVDSQLVIDEMTAAGFELIDESDLLRNPEDTRDFNVFRDVATKRDNTDRFVLKFQKPA
ncbi:MAG: class I SAM-dependent methyltransferase [Kordiimonadaceae bacterium]|nr:class I SAM-dependent methyltransferase [Kordiimonadaceae bacterium]